MGKPGQKSLCGPRQAVIEHKYTDMERGKLDCFWSLEEYRSQNAHWQNAWKETPQCLSQKTNSPTSARVSSKHWDYVGIEEPTIQVGELPIGQVKMQELILPSVSMKKCLICFQQIYNQHCWWIFLQNIYTNRERQITHNGIKNQDLENMFIPLKSDMKSPQLKHGRKDRQRVLHEKAFLWLLCTYTQFIHCKKYSNWSIWDNQQCWHSSHMKHSC